MNRVTAIANGVNHISMFPADYLFGASFQNRNKQRYGGISSESDGEIVLTKVSISENITIFVAYLRNGDTLFYFGDSVFIICSHKSGKFSIRR